MRVCSTEATCCVEHSEKVPSPIRLTILISMNKCFDLSCGEKIEPDPIQTPPFTTILESQYIQSESALGQFLFNRQKCSLLYTGSPTSLYTVGDTPRLESENAQPINE